MAENLMQWVQDARVFAEESLDDEDFRKLEANPGKQKVYREVAISGMGTYNRMKEMLGETDDPMIPFDLSREAMLDTLGQQMDKLFPGWLKARQEPEDPGDWREQMRRAGLL